MYPGSTTGTRSSATMCASCRGQGCRRDAHLQVLPQLHGGQRVEALPRQGLQGIHRPACQIPHLRPITALMLIRTAEFTEHVPSASNRTTQLQECAVTAIDREFAARQATVTAAVLQRTMSRMAASNDAAEKAAILDEVASGWPSKSST